MYVSNTIQASISQLNATGIDADLNMGAYTVFGADYVGKIVWQAEHATAPRHTLPCDGAAVSRAVYSALFTTIGVAYGAGDGVTTFNVPTLKGKMILGYDAGDADYNAVARTGGEKTHALVTAELAAHTHTQGTHAHTASQPTHTHTISIANAGGATATMAGPSNATAGGTAETSGSGNNAVTVNAGSAGAIANAGSDTAHENRSPYVVMKGFIYY